MLSIELSYGVNARGNGAFLFDLPLTMVLRAGNYDYRYIIAGKIIATHETGHHFYAKVFVTLNEGVYMIDDLKSQAVLLPGDGRSPLIERVMVFYELAETLGQ